MTRDLNYELSELDLASLDELSLDHQTCDKTPTTALAIAEAPPLWPVSAYRGLDTAIAGEARAAALRINARTRANTIEPLSNPLRGLLRVSRFSIAAYKNVVTLGVIGP